MQQSGDVDITLITPYPDSFAHLLSARYRNQRYTGPAFSVDPAGFPRYHVPVLSIPGFFKSTEAASLQRWFLKQARSLWVKHGPFDVIDVHWGYPDLPAAMALAELWKIPVNMTLRGMETFYPGDFRETRVAQALSECDGVISLSEQMLSHARNCCVLQASEQSVIINGSDPNVFGFRDQTESRQRLGIEPRHIVLLGIGSLIFRKGFHCVIQALAELQHEFPELHYYILGAESAEPGHRDALQQLSERLGISDRVHLMGAVPNRELADWYAAADWFVLSSAGEGSPNVLSESLMSGCPVISTPVGAVPDIMALSCRSGHLFPPGALRVFDGEDPLSQSHWRETLMEILRFMPRASPKQRRMLSQDMRSYDWRWCAEKTCEHLKRVAQPVAS